MKHTFADLQSEIIGSGFDFNVQPIDIGRSITTQQAVDISSAGVKNTDKKRAAKFAELQGKVNKAKIARSKAEVDVQQASLQQPRLFNLGF